MPSPHPLSRRRLLAGLGAGLAATALPRPARAALGDPEYFEVSHHEVELPHLSEAHDGLRVVQLSDLHVGDETPDGRLLKALATVRALQPDLVVLTGDYVTDSPAPLDHLPIVLAHLPGPAVAVLGNHDHEVDARAVTRGLERIGVAVLHNRSTVLSLRGEPLRLLGIDDGASGHDDVVRTFQGFGEREAGLVLTHAPPTADLLPPDRGLLCLSGHTHGGQIHVGGLTDWVMRRAGQPYVRGHYGVRGNRLFVSRGLGFGHASSIPRIGADPELAVFTLRAPRRSPQQQRSELQPHEVTS